MGHHDPMQNRYVGDVGDFLKLGILRLLGGSLSDSEHSKIGIVWYLVPDELGNGDGKHVTYLEANSPRGRILRPLDPDLYDELARIVQRRPQTVVDIEQSGVLPPDTETFSQVLDFSNLSPSSQSLRIERRAAWLEGALAATASSDIVFLDPDNGIRSATHRVRSHQSKAIKHAYFDEITRFLERGQSVIAYHHADRSAALPIQAERRMEEFRKETGASPLCALCMRQGTSRFFFVIPSPNHAHALAKKMSLLTSGPWGQLVQQLPIK